MNFKRFARRACAGISALALAGVQTAHAQTGAVGTAVNTALGGITTPQIMSETISALPGCLNYSVTGVCFFLKCELFYCYITETIKVKHYMPDVVVSTYSAPDQHPWTDVGRMLSATLKGPGDAITGYLTDSQADTGPMTPTHETIVMGKSADAIGNPVGAIIGGNMAFEFPDFMQLAQFPATELPRIGQLWAQVPSSLLNSTVSGASSMLADAKNLVGQIQNLPGNFSSMLSNVGSLGNLGSVIPSMNDLTSNIASFQDMVGQVGQIMGGATGQGNGNGMDASSFIDSMNALICPGASSMFGIDYDSDLDGLFWRGFTPLEQLYPQSWIPGLSGGDVTQSGVLVNTWGSVYPRSNQLTQTDPVKGSAVIAARVASIIDQAAQPHIYHQLTGKGNKKYFEQAGNPKWQMLYPVASSSCITFGSNDSLTLGSFGDGKTSGNNGYVWNLWQQYECCQKNGSFLFSVP